MGTDSTLASTVLDFFSAPQVQSALISASVAFAVVFMTGRKERRTRRAQRAELLLGIYSPLADCIDARGLLNCWGTHKGIVRDNRAILSKPVRPLLEAAGKVYDGWPKTGIGLDTRSPAKKAKDEEKAKESQEASEEIASSLLPLLRKEIKRLQKIVDNNSG
jgi:hypothetical protein